jgi:methylenetetrahydrofolate reductase (NADPH)
MTPFSQGPLSPESLTIMTHLEQLTRKSWWTVGSQPAVDGNSSSDHVFGWGPKGGYVFQKSFVEFFCESEDLELIGQRAKHDGAVHWLAANNEVRVFVKKLSSISDFFLQGQFRTNMTEDTRNAVTWGVFPGQEIIQTTIIEPESFLSWKVRFSISQLSRACPFLIDAHTG